MQYAIATSQPFSFDQTIAFVRRFPAVQGDYVVRDDAISAAVAVDGKPIAFTLRSRGTELVVETTSRRVVKLAADFVGASDDIARLYAIAEGDPPFRAIVKQLYGLHHVRFLTLGEIAVYTVMMQRAPINVAAAYKRRFLERFGLPIEIEHQTLHAMPELATLAGLAGEQIGQAIGHRTKGERIAEVVHGVAALGEVWLREAPYAEARDALRAIQGIGPFSAAAILLRGLGRMDELPAHRNFEEAGRAVYGAAFDPAKIVARYGTSIGYWAFYVMAAEGRRRSPMAVAATRGPLRSAA